MSIAYPLIRLSISHTSHVATGKSTRPRGARLRRTICDFWSRNFNPRARMGRDSLWTSLSQSFASFNPRARLGRNFLHTTSPAVVTLFQSTRPRGARLSPNWTNTNYSTKQSYIKAATKLTKITRPAVPQFCCQGTRANIVINQHHLPFARHRARRLAKPQGHKVSSHQNAPPFFANSSRGYIHAGYLLTHQ